MAEKYRAVVITESDDTWRCLSEVFARLEVDGTRVSSVERCKQIFRRDMVDLVFSDETVADGDYWDIYGAMKRGLISTPKVVLMSPTMGAAECELAKHCGIFAVIESPCRQSAVESTIAYARRSVRDDKTRPTTESVPTFDIFSGLPDRDALWVCAVRGLANAREKMERIASEKPGRYFIFYSIDRTILAQTETFAEPEANKRSSGDLA